MKATPAQAIRRYLDKGNWQEPVDFADLTAAVRWLLSDEKLDVSGLQKEMRRLIDEEGYVPPVRII